MGRIGVCVFALRVVFVGVLLNLALVRMGSALPIGNAIKNPGFEDGLAFWSVSMGTATYSADNTVFLIGSGARRGSSPSEAAWAGYSRTLRGCWSSAEITRFSGWIKTEGVSRDGGGVVLGLDYVNALGVSPADGFVKGIGAISGTNDWSFFQSAPFILSPMPADASALWFLTDFNDSSGTAWFDEVALIGPLVKSPVPAPTALLLLLAGLGTIILLQRRGCRMRMGATAKLRLQSPNAWLPTVATGFRRAATPASHQLSTSDSLPA